MCWTFFRRTAVFFFNFSFMEVFKGNDLILSAAQTFNLTKNNLLIRKQTRGNLSTQFRCLGRFAMSWYCCRGQYCCVEGKKATLRRFHLFLKSILLYMGKYFKISREHLLQKLKILYGVNRRKELSVKNTPHKDRKAEKRISTVVLMNSNKQLKPVKT